MKNRHSDITTTINYQKNFTFKEADDALDKVIGGKQDSLIKYYRY